MSNEYTFNFVDFINHQMSYINKSCKKMFNCK